MIALIWILVERLALDFGIDLVLIDACFHWELPGEKVGYFLINCVLILRLPNC